MAKERAAEPAAATATASRPRKPRGKGRPRVEWTPSRQKKLLRLYLCTSNQELRLDDILQILHADAFNPGKRNAHGQLSRFTCCDRTDPKGNMRALRPKGLSAVAVRQLLRSARAERRWMRSTAAVEPVTPPPEGSGSGSPSGSPSGGALVVAASSLNRPTKAPSGRLSFCSSIWSDIRSLTRSSSSSNSGTATTTSSKRTTTVDDSLSKMTRDAFLAHLKATPSKATASSKMRVFHRSSNKAPPPAKPTSKDVSKFLVDSCCSKHPTAVRPPADVASSPCCVHQRLLWAIKDQRAKGHAFVDFVQRRATAPEVNAVDKFGNTLLHLAAMWGARVSLLQRLLQHIHNAGAVNKRGETFLHVFDPPPEPEFGAAGFAKLVRYLLSRGFDFCRRDADKRVFLHHLVLRREFQVQWLPGFFGELNFASARFLVAKRSTSGERLWYCVHTGLDRRQKGLATIVFGDEREQGFVRRCLPEFRVRAASPAYPSAHACSSSSSSSSTAASSSRDDVRSKPDLLQDPEFRAGRTRLMALLLDIGVSGRHFRDEDLRARMKSLARGNVDELLSCDKEGNTALHYAAEFGIVAAVAFLCSSPGHAARVNACNNCGNTPLRLVKYALQRTEIGTDMHMETRYIRCAVLLLDQGAGDHLTIPPRADAIKPSRQDGEIWDGSEQIQALVRVGAATECKGLHLLSPVRGESEPVKEEYVSPQPWNSGVVPAMPALGDTGGLLDPRLISLSPPAWPLSPYVPSASP